MPSSTDQVTAVPLRLIAAKFYLDTSRKDPKFIVCAASSCGGALEQDNFDKAYDVIGDGWEEDIEITQTAEELRQLALWLLCPDHEDGVGEMVAQAWENQSLDDDIFQLLNLHPPDMTEWKCLEKGCEQAVMFHCSPEVKDCHRVITIMERLTPSAIVRECLSDKERVELLTELVTLLRCKKHYHGKIKDMSDKWNNILTRTIQRRKTKDSSYKEITRSHSSVDTRVSGQQLDDNRSTLLSSENETRGSQTEKAVPTLPSSSSASVQSKENAIFEKANRNVGPHQIDLKLISFIRSKKANTGKKLDRSMGDVYVFQNPEWPNHVKIGQTRGDPDDRMAAIKKKCNIECLEQVFDPARKDFRFYELVERLCHKELKNFKKQLLCKSCKTKKNEQQTHHEWFQVKPEVAVRTVQKWRKWMSQSPYDEDGDLVPWWREKPIDGLLSEQQPNGEKETIDDHDSRHQRWSRWLERPSTRERTKFEIWRFFCDVRPKRKSLWNTTEKNPGPLLIYFIMVWFICNARDCILLTLVLLLVLRDWA